MWTANLFQVTSGRIGPRLEYTDLSWEIDLNDTETIKVTMLKSALPKVESALWLEPLWAGIVLFWDGKPIVAGPILSRTNETEKSITFDAKGIRAMLARRLIIQELSDWSGLNKTTLSFEGLSLGTIAKEVVKWAQKKPGGSLPIAFPLEDELWPNDDADHTRNYRGFNLQNINGDQILTKLSEVTNGPDIMFKPRLLRQNQLVFDMWHGTERDPRIFQSEMKVWDTTAERNDISGITIINTGVYMTQRVFSLGAGQDEGQMITVSSNLAAIDAGYPLVETVVQTSDSENADVVRAHGDSSLNANLGPLKEIQMNVRGDGINQFGSFWPGDVCEVVIKDWVALPDGKYRMRILNMTGDNSVNTRLSLQLA
jgi:hypothetical protein